VAVIGCGYWGKNLVRNFGDLGALEAVVDTDQATVATLVGEHGGRALSLEAALLAPDIEAVAISAPAALHYELAKKALTAGKHAFVEKPLALTVKEASELCDLAERGDRRLMVGHLLQYHPAFLKLKELVREGQLGRLQYLYSNRLNLGKIRREEDILWSFAPHDLSMILSLVGSEPDHVDAVGGYYLHETIADVTTTQLHFAGGERAHVFVSWLHPFKEQKLVVVGSDAMAVFDDGEPWARKLLLYAHRVEWRNNMPVPAKVDPRPVEIVEDEPLKRECVHFLDCVLSGARPRTDGREGLRVLAVLERATSALKKASAADRARRLEMAAPDAPAAADYPGVFIHESAYVDAGVAIGAGSKIWHFSHILGQVRIGTNVTIGQNVVIGPRVSIGSNVRVQNNVSIYEGVTLEDGVFCGPSCVFTNVNNPRAEISRKSELRPTLVRRGASIGANATIICGRTLGEYCFIAAGAVVAKDVPAFALMAGVPARRIGWMSKAGMRLGPDLVCPKTGTRYALVGPDRLEEIS
jgi:predicted dehydrogenase/acetyltransferase-like isoleucine patch superfamily enzyme